MKELHNEENLDVIIINDGSDEKYDNYFEMAEKYGFTVLRHAKNQGKGRALKTAINYCLNTYSDIIGYVTADSDGQHTILDIKNVRKS